MTTSRTRKTTSGNDDNATKAEPTTKAATKKSAAKKSAAKKEGGTSPTPRKRASAPTAAAKPKVSAARIASEAARQLTELSGKQTEGVTSLERTDDGWKIQVEVVELRRIPETTDVLAIYELDVDDQGDLEGYRRMQRYTRGAADGQ